MTPVAAAAGGTAATSHADAEPHGLRGHCADHDPGLSADFAPRVAAAALDPDTAQHTFRAVLDALARPGAVRRLPARVGVPAALLPALALADLGTPVCVLDGDGGWGEVVATVTSAPLAPLAGARIVTALRPADQADLAAAPRGSAAAPEEAALVALAVPGLGGGPPLRLAGPGVDGTVTVAPQGLAPGLRAARAAQFPAGVDLLLVAPDGALLGLPRSITIEE
ncbi:MAG: phosphonate C-P lyase system protein PhnH, partial [Pseudonocardia sp.]|nr:phosphonate C-P lyase system protein PhnH [Pseudonocardia sp.]